MEQQQQEKSPFFVNKGFIHRETLQLDGKDYIFGFKELSGYDRDIINRDAVEINKETKEITANIEKGNLAILKQALVEAPFEITIDNLKSLKDSLQKQLLQIADKINKPDAQIIKN